MGGSFLVHDRQDWVLRTNTITAQQALLLKNAAGTVRKGCLDYIEFLMAHDMKAQSFPPVQASVEHKHA